MVQENDLGGAGFYGFKKMSADPNARSQLRQVNYFHGGHAAATQEDNWDAIGHFLIHGTQATLPDSLYQPRRTLTETIGSKLGFVVWSFILFVIYKIYGATTDLVGSLSDSLGSTEIPMIAGGAITMLVVYKILTKV